MRRKEASGEAKTAHLMKLGTREPALSEENIDNLPEEDLLMYEELKAGGLPDKEWQEYIKDVEQDFDKARREGRAEDPLTFPRHILRAYLANMLSLTRMRAEVERMRRDKKQNG